MKEIADDSTYGDYTAQHGYLFKRRLDDRSNHVCRNQEFKAEQQRRPELLPEEQLVPLGALMAQRNLTDPDSRIMPGPGGKQFEQCYNAQAAVDGVHAK